jgi:hypothetical protein
LKYKRKIEETLQNLVVVMMMLLQQVVEKSTKVEVMIEYPCHLNSELE